MVLSFFLLIRRGGEVYSDLYTPSAIPNKVEEIIQNRTSEREAELIDQTEMKRRRTALAAGNWRCKHNGVGG